MTDNDSTETPLTLEEVHAKMEASDHKMHVTGEKIPLEDLRALLSQHETASGLPATDFYHDTAELWPGYSVLEARVQLASLVAVSRFAHS